jgi:hypothetical protein
MRADYLRRRHDNPDEAGAEYRELLDAYDRAGLPLERVLTRLGCAAWLLARGQLDEAESVLAVAQEVIRQSGLLGLAADGWALALAIARRQGNEERRAAASGERQRCIERTGIIGPSRP